MRRKPYTVIGLRRLKCWRNGCGNRAEYQWQICSDGNVFRPICPECDIEMNALILAFMGDPEGPRKIREYTARRRELA